MSNGLLEHLSEDQRESVVFGKPVSSVVFVLKSLPVAAGVALGTWWWEVRTIYVIAALTVIAIGLISAAFMLWRFLSHRALKTDSEPGPE